MLSRVSDVVLAMPVLLIAIGIGAACGSTPRAASAGTSSRGSAWSSS